MKQNSFHGVKVLQHEGTQGCPQHFMDQLGRKMTMARTERP